MATKEESKTAEITEQLKEVKIDDMPKLEDLTWRCFESEKDLAKIMKMMKRDLSEPYPIYTYRYFVH